MAVDLNDLSTNDKIVGGCSLGLVISLLFFNWHSVDTGFGTYTVKATGDPNGFYGLLALLLTFAVGGSFLAKKLADVELPELPIPWGQAWLYGAGGIEGLLLIKLISETEALGLGAYLSIILGGGLAYGAFMMSKEGDEGGSAAGGGGEPQAF